jgi:hypothetical protein
MRHLLLNHRANYVPIRVMTSSKLALKDNVETFGTGRRQHRDRSAKTVISGDRPATLEIH